MRYRKPHLRTPGANTKALPCPNPDPSTDNRTASQGWSFRSALTAAHMYKIMGTRVQGHSLRHADSTPQDEDRVA